MRKIKVARATATTTPGFVNPNGQMVVRATGAGSESFPGQRVYHLRCRHCAYDYGPNGTDVLKRLCPNCQQGTPGERLQAASAELYVGGLFDR